MCSRLLVLVLLVFAVATGCGSDGRTLAPPTAAQTTTTRPPPPTSAPDAESSASGVVLSSPDFAPGGQTPLDATCGGANVFPSLAWTDVPAQASELAIALVDQTDPNEPLLLWLMAGINPNERGMEAGFYPAGAFETLNDYGSLGWGSPCLEGLGEGQRDLQFRLYVLSTPSGVAEGDPGNEAWDTVAAASIESASLLMRITSEGA